MFSYMVDIEASDCPRNGHNMTDDGADETTMIAINTLTGEAECECGEIWIYGAAELLEILNNLED